jgi:cyclopropane fatty-acyl-phospholipid synthase-like methyltransferase
MPKPYSESCDQNKDPILTIISPLLSAHLKVLEIGTGTGQHAIYFAENMPHLTWYTSDCAPYLDGIRMWLDEAALANTVSPFELNVSTSRWPEFEVDAIFTANTLHIMPFADVANLFSGAGELLEPDGSLLIYGPFNYNGLYTSESNERFDHWLKSRDPLSGNMLANKNRLQLIMDYELPANNRILHFSKK